MSDWFDDDGAQSRAKKTARQAAAETRRLPGVEDPVPAMDEADWDFSGIKATAEEESPEEDEENEGGEANIEFDRDKFYDGLGAAGTAVDLAGTATGSPHAKVAGKAMKGSAFVGKQVGKFLDGAADYADDAAHTRHVTGDLKIINDKKDKQASDEINKGQGKHDSRVTKDD